MLPAPRIPFSKNRFLHFLLLGYGLIWIATAVAPRDWLTFLLENLLVVVFISVLAFTYRRFAFSNVSYFLIAIFLCLHAVGAHYGYAHMPVGDWLKTAFGLSRNYYDRVIHCAFGLLLACPLREILLRAANVRHGPANLLSVSSLLAASSIFEILEAIVAEIVSPGRGPDWLGAQGDEWDAQWDMIATLLGATAAMLVMWSMARGSRHPSPKERPVMHPKAFRERRLLQLLCICYALVWIISAINPVKQSDWLLENLLVFASVPALVWTYRRFPLSDGSYTLIFVFLVLHAAGAHYTYAEVPLGYWLAEAFHLDRNHFDRMVHFSFGLLLTPPFRELLNALEKPRGLWASILPATVIVSCSGVFELIEAVVAWIVNPELGQAYLGTQGDVWDAQKDMALAAIGAVLSLKVFAAGRSAFIDLFRPAS